MHARITSALVGFVVLSLAGCNRSADNTTTTAASSVTSTSTAVTADGSDQAVKIDVVSLPDPPQAGDNTLDVTVANPDGSPVTDASVAATYYMPAMPSMNMPAMRSEFAFTNTGNGHYQGKGQLEMSGTWNVTLTVSRNGEPLATKKLSVIAK